MNKLPAGLIDHNYEFFNSPQLHAMCINHGTVKTFEDLPASVHIAIARELDKYHDKIAAIRERGVTGFINILREFVSCNYGGFDHVPDMVDGQLQEPEYWPCPERGKCRQEGRLCTGLKTDSGEFLTRREIDVLKLIAEGDQDKQIAGILHISVHTVLKHNLHLRRKTGLQSKTQLTRFAIQKHLV